MRRFLAKAAWGVGLVATAGLIPEVTLAQTTSTSRPDYPPSSQVLGDFKQIPMLTDEDRPALWNLYKHLKEERVLAELSPQYLGQKYYIAPTVSSGEMYAGLQGEPLFVYWRKYGTRLALMSPNIEIRTSGDAEAQSSVNRLFTDRVLLEVPIVTMGPQGGPIIDLTSMLLNNSALFFGGGSRFSNSGYRVSNPNLITHKKVKVFPENVEVAIEGPMGTGQLKTLHFSISVINSNPSYQPRAADSRIGYFTTTYSDYGKYKEHDNTVRYINRWHLAKRDPSLKLSPPVKPIRFILESTVPVRYRRWVAQGVNYWNKSFEKVGILNAIEVDYQDAQTGRNMKLDPEDVRYNFVRWLNNNQGTAIGPSRVNPMTGEILDADIILTDGWIRHYWKQFEEILPAVAMEGFNAEALAWFATHPNWDPRVRLASPGQRPEIMRQIQRDSLLPLAGHEGGRVDPKLIGDDTFDGLIGQRSQTNGLCLAGDGLRLDLALMQMELAMAQFDADEVALQAPAAGGEKKDEKKEEKKEEPKKPEEAMLDGMPESFIGPLLAELVAHEVGHTLGLRHNFKASSVYDLKQINSDELKGKKPLSGSVMDYIPVNFNVSGGEKQGDWTMIGVGPYDEWAIEYGYTIGGDLKQILARVNEPELLYGTDEDVGGADPRSRRYDFSKNPLDYANDQIRLLKKERERLLKAFVKDGESWARARQGYELTLALQTRSISMMSNWVGGSFTSRAKKGDKDAPKPIEVVAVDRQRAALKFVIDNTFVDDAFGLTPELLQHLNVEKWLDAGDRAFRDEESWPVHDRIIGIQASALSMLLSPTTLRRVYDNEMRIPADQDAVTLPEVLTSITDSLWTELKDNPTKQHTARVPMVTSLRANLQREHVDHLIDLAVPGPLTTEAYKPISNLASMELTRVLERVNRVLGEAKEKVDPYTIAHLEKMKEKIQKTKDGQFIYNAKDIGGGGLGGIIFFGQDKNPQPVQSIPAPFPALVIPEPATPAPTTPPATPAP